MVYSYIVPMPFFGVTFYVISRNLNFVSIYIGDASRILAFLAALELNSPLQESL